MSRIDKIDLHQFTYAELSELNSRVVERMKYIHSVKQLQSMAKFHLGQRVCFDSDFETVTGTLTKINQKTVTISADDGMIWRVGPCLLRPFVEEKAAKNLKVVR